MCRFMCYKGEHEEVIWDLISKPKHSLIHQSFESKERVRAINADGFGIAWYNDIDDQPALFKSERPAWNDPNLQTITSKISSSCFAFHIRDANVGDINVTNAHPFVYDKLTMMHNGSIAEFGKIKRKLRTYLDDEFYAWVKGSTDSEHFFALFTQNLKKYGDMDSIGDVVVAIRKTIKIINKLLDDKGISGSTQLNLNITNGKFIVACRYANNGKAPSLYYSKMGKISYVNNIFNILTANETRGKSILIVSEKFDDITDSWTKIPKNNILCISEKFDLSLVEI